MNSKKMRKGFRSTRQIVGEQQVWDLGYGSNKILSQY